MNPSTFNRMDEANRERKNQEKQEKLRLIK